MKLKPCMVDYNNEMRPVIIDVSLYYHVAVFGSDIAPEN